MGLFSFFQKKQTVSQEVKGEADLELYTPISGNLISLEEVPDLVISERLIGDGVAWYQAKELILLCHLALALSQDLLLQIMLLL